MSCGPVSYLPGLSGVFSVMSEMPWDSCGGGPESHCVSQESRDGSADHMQVSTWGDLNSFLASQIY